MSCACAMGPSDPRCCLYKMHNESEEAIVKEFNNLRGRILGLIESWGLPESQERGAKSTFKSLTYDAQKRVTDLVVTG